MGYSEDIDIMADSPCLEPNLAYCDNTPYRKYEALCLLRLQVHMWLSLCHALFPAARGIFCACLTTISTYSSWGFPPISFDDLSVLHVLQLLGPGGVDDLHDDLRWRQRGCVYLHVNAVAVHFG